MHMRRSTRERIWSSGDSSIPSPVATSTHWPSREAALRIFGRVLASAYGTTRPVSAQRERTEAVKALIAAAPRRNVSLRALAAAAETSPFHLCRAFRRSAGMSITAYRHSLRLRQSLELVRNPTADLTAVALDLGYSSHSHFTFAFRRHFGITPSQYRRAEARRYTRSQQPAF